MLDKPAVRCYNSQVENKQSVCSHRAAKVGTVNTIKIPRGIFVCLRTALTSVFLCKNEAHVSATEKGGINH